MKSLVSFIAIMVLFLGINSASATEDNATEKLFKTNDAAEIYFIKLDEKIAAGSNSTVFLIINSSKEGDLNISLQRNDYKLTFFNRSRVDKGRKQYDINFTLPSNLDDGLYELTAEFNGVKETKNVFVEKNDISNEKIRSIYIIIILVGFIGLLFLVARYIVFKKLYEALFVTILIGGSSLNLIFLKIQTIPFLNLPTYVILSSFLGALAYVFISWYRTGVEILEGGQTEAKAGVKILTGDQTQAKDMYMKWSSRLIAAPIIGIIIYFGAKSIFNLTLGTNSDYAIATLCMASGLFIKPILWRARDTVFSVFAPAEKIKDDLEEFSTTDIGKLIGPKMALDLRDKFGYTELKEFAALSEERRTEIAKGINAQDSWMKIRIEISNLWMQIRAFGPEYAGSLEEAEKLYYGFNIKTLEDIKSKKDILKPEIIGIAEKKLEKWKEKDFPV